MERFKAEILNSAPPDESQGELIKLFWTKLPPDIKELHLTPLNFDSIDEVLLEALDIAYYTGSDNNVLYYRPSN